MTNRKGQAAAIERLNGMRRAREYLSAAERQAFIRNQLKELEQQKLGNELFILMNEGNEDLDTPTSGPGGQALPSTREQIALARVRIRDLEQASANIENRFAKLLTTQEKSRPAAAEE